MVRVDKHGSPPEPGVVTLLFKEKKVYIMSIGVVGPPGFEPGISGSEGRCPIQARPRALLFPEFIYGLSLKRIVFIHVR